MNRFNGGSGNNSSNLSDGTVNAVLASLKIPNMIAGFPVKISGDNKLISEKISISDIDGDVIVNPYIGDFKASDFETDDYFSLNTEIQKIDNLTASSATDTNVSGIINTDEVSADKIYDKSKSVWIDLNTTDISVNATNFVVNSNNLPNQITGLETKTQNITGVASTTTVSGLIECDAFQLNSDKIKLGILSGDTGQSARAVAIGYQAGQSSQSPHSVAIGTDAGKSSQNSNSIAIGYTAGSNLQNINCVAIGREAGLTQQNQHAIALGWKAGKTRQKRLAIAIGTASGEIEQGEDSIGIGRESGQITQGNYSVAIGFISGQTTQGSSCVAVGRQSGANNQGDNSVAIGSKAGILNQDDNSIILNGTGLDLNSTNTDSLYIKPIREVQNDEFLKYNSLSGEITRDGSGITLTSDADNNLYAGNLAGSGITTGTKNLLIGNSAGSGITTFNDNVGIGYQALLNSNNEANTAVGSGSLQNATGRENTAIGFQSMKGSIEGYAERNTAIGSDSMFNISHGDDNVCIGDASGYGITTGDNNVIIGSQNEDTNNPNNCIAIGYQAIIDSGTNRVAIGHQATTTADNQVVIGNSSITENRFFGALNLTNPTDTTSRTANTYLPITINTIQYYIPLYT